VPIEVPLDCTEREQELKIGHVSHDLSGACFFSGSNGDGTALEVGWRKLTRPCGSTPLALITTLRAPVTVRVGY
jgi:hypothetical protein